jgi:hypothetical protein
MAGNLGKLVVRKRPGDDPHASLYDEERILAFTHGMPFRADDAKGGALRHATAEEDWVARSLGIGYDFVPTDFGGKTVDDSGNVETEVSR